jgi:hypothetical protein
MKKPKMHRLLGLLLAAATCAVVTGNAQQPPDSVAPPASQTATNTLAEGPDQATNNTSTTSSNAASDDQSEWHRRGNPLVVIGHDVDLKAGETAQAVVVIGGSATIHGKVHDAAVVVFGDLDVEGEVGEAVAVMGGVKLGPNARVHHETVAVGGKLDADTSAKLGEQDLVQTMFPQAAAPCPPGRLGLGHCRGYLPFVCGYSRLVPATG